MEDVTESVYNNHRRTFPVSCGHFHFLHNWLVIRKLASVWLSLWPSSQKTLIVAIQPTSQSWFHHWLTFHHTKCSQVSWFACKCLFSVQHQWRSDLAQAKDSQQGRSRKENANHSEEAGLLKNYWQVSLSLSLSVCWQDISAALSRLSLSRDWHIWVGSLHLLETK